MPEFTFEFKMPQDPERRHPEDINQEMMDKANGFFQAGSSNRSRKFGRGREGLHREGGHGR